MAARSLHAVKPGEAPAETPKRKRAKKITEAARESNRRDLLVAMRARIAQAVEDPKTPARDLAALSRRLLEIAKEIEAIDATTRGSEGDDVGAAADIPDEEWAAT